MKHELDEIIEKIRVEEEKESMKLMLFHISIMDEVEVKKTIQSIKKIKTVYDYTNGKSYYNRLLNALNDRYKTIRQEKIEKILKDND